MESFYHEHNVSLPEHVSFLKKKKKKARYILLLDEGMKWNPGVLFIPLRLGLWYHPRLCAAHNRWCN